MRPRESELQNFGMMNPRSLGPDDPALVVSIWQAYGRALGVFLQKFFRFVLLLLVAIAKTRRR